MERVILITIVMPDPGGWGASAAEREFLSLAESCNIKVVHDEVVLLEAPQPKYFIGSGKVEQILERVREHEADAVIFSRDLSGSQQRNLENILDAKMIDRTQLILDIFARRAKSMEGKLQVELAQLSYLLPRLGGKGILLSRLGGGIGTRGPGEQKLETDRRRIRDRIRLLKRDQRQLSRRRNFYREKRHETGIPTVALVGYTNAGKSTLFNALTHSKVVVRDQLFSTLDPTARRLILPNKQKMLLVDTVGLLHNLPHHLIDAFRATLEEASVADLILHVTDISSKEHALQDKSVMEVLHYLELDKKQRLKVFNKVDKIEDKRVSTEVDGRSVSVSAKNHQGLDVLIERIQEEFLNFRVRETFFFTHGSEDLLHRVYEDCEVLEREDHETGIHITANVPHKLVNSIRRQLEARLGGTMTDRPKGVS